MLHSALGMYLLALSVLFAPSMAGAPPADELLTALAKSSASRHSAVYSGLRQYAINNLRFGKSAAAVVRLEAQPSDGKHFTIVSQSGSGRLIRVIETLLSSEADFSKPGRAHGHEIGPSNYTATVIGSESLNSRDCWVLALTPKTKNKYLLNGTAWVDKETNALVRLDGTTAASVSMWVGTPHIIEDFAPVGGIWLPVHTISKSNSFLLGESDLDIQYTDYEIKSAYPTVAKAANSPAIISRK